MSTQTENGRRRKRGKRGQRQTTPSGVVPPDSTDGGTPLHQGTRAAEDEVDKAGSVSADDRRQLASEGKALPDGSYPIPDAEHLRSAVRLAVSGHGDVKAARKLIERRAKELGRTDLLPQDWGAAKAADGRPGPMTADEFGKYLDDVRKGTRHPLSGQYAAELAHGHALSAPHVDGGLAGHVHVDQQGNAAMARLTAPKVTESMRPGDHPESSATCGRPAEAVVTKVDLCGPAGAPGVRAVPGGLAVGQVPNGDPNSSSVQPRNLGGLSGDGVGGAPVQQTGSQISPTANGGATAPTNRVPFVNPARATGRAPGE